MFVRSENFVRAYQRLVEALPAKYQDWYGDQMALRDLGEGGIFRIRSLPENKWNFVPDHDGHGLAATGNDVRIWHFKGPERKGWMANYAANFGRVERAKHQVAS